MSVQVQSAATGFRAHGAVIRLADYARPLPKATDRAKSRANKLIETRAARLDAKVDKRADGCWIWTGSVGIATQYGQIRDVSPKTGKPTMRNTHVVAWELANGRQVPQGMKVCHAIGCSKLCCRPHHLRIGTHKENLADAIVEKRGVGRKKLTGAQVQEIVAYRQNYRLTNEMLACMYGVSATAIAHVFSGRTHSRFTGFVTDKTRKGGRPRKQVQAREAA
jgi:hypothetical protein